MRFGFLAVLLAWTVFLPVPASAQTKHKNVVLLIADDLGRDLGCYGNKTVQSPNLDRFAKKGVRFTNGYATVASCSPSRSTIFTGLYTHQNGMYGLAHAGHAQKSHDWVRSLPNLLRLAGYWTGIIGKVHVTPDSVYNWETTMGKVNPRSPEGMTKKAKEFLDQRKDRPFFLVMGYTDPHRAPKYFANDTFAKDPKEIKYDPAKIQLPYHIPDKADARKDMAEYYQSVSRLDRAIGMFLEMLREEGLDENTLVIFLSDNGIPFPGAKTTLYEAGIHLPLIMHAPGMPSGRTNHAMVSWIDIAPTILDWTGAKGPSYKLPGRSVLPVLGEDRPKGWDTVFGSHQFHEITMYYPMRTIVTEKYKLIVNLDHKKESPLPSDLWGSDTWQGIRQRGDKMLGQRSVDAFLNRPKLELYDLTNDPNELNNLASNPDHAETLKNLQFRLRRWQDDTTDPWRIVYREEDPKFNAK